MGRGIRRGPSVALSVRRRASAPDGPVRRRASAPDGVAPARKRAGRARTGGYFNFSQYSAGMSCAIFSAPFAPPYTGSSIRITRP